MKISILTLNILFFVINLLHAQTQDSCCYRTIGCDTLNELRKSDEVLIIDTRSLKGFEQGHIENAFLASDKQELTKLVEKKSRTMSIVVYCDKGKRSKDVAKILCGELKFSKVFSLHGGISKWEKEGYPVIKD